MTLAKVPDLLVKSPASEVKSSPTWWLDRLASSSARALGGSGKQNLRECLEVG